MAANSGAYTSQFGSGSLILYCSRIRKYVTYRIRKNVTEDRTQRTDREQRTDRFTEREFNYRGHSYPLWIAGGSGPIVDP